MLTSTTAATSIHLLQIPLTHGFSKIAVAGGTGNLGPSIVNSLVNAGFEVTLLSRSSSRQVDPRTKVLVVDYNSLESLTTALLGQDAVVNALGVGMVPGDIHLRLVEAAHGAKIKRYIPSEFGSDTANPLTAKLPVFGDKIAVVQNLEKISAQDQSFTYTAVISGPIFDWGLENSFLINLSGPTTPIYDGGDVPVSTTTLAGVGRAVAGVLKKPDETKNRYVCVSEAQFTQNKILEWAKKANMIEKVPVKTEVLEQKAYEALKQPTPDLHTFARCLILRAIFGGKYGSQFSRTDMNCWGFSSYQSPRL